VVSVFGRCHIQLTGDDIQMMDTNAAAKTADEEESVAPVKAPPVSTEVEDSDEDEDEIPSPAPSAVPEVKQEPVTEAKDSVEPPKKKTVVKKKVAA
jgi:hypothetical protein